MLPFLLVSTFLKAIIIIICILISVAYFTHAERKVLAVIQRRSGPNVVGIFGLLQPLADGLKLFLKETISPANAQEMLFLVSPVISFIISLLSWAVIPFDNYATFVEIHLSILYIFGISSLGVYGVVMSGWSSNSKYAFLGSLRSTSQMISYEISIGFTIIIIGLCCESFNLNDIIIHQTNIWFFIPFFPLFLIFFISGLAETNRHPFDLPEAEAELVSGYNVEYSSMVFALFSLAEYSNMLVMCALNVVFFFGGWLPPFKFLSFIPGVIWFSLKLLFFVFLFIVARALLPRYRYDQLMFLGWKIFLPLVLTFLLATSIILFFFEIYHK
jgi:NADH-quinone oxidoreductase subunit H